MADKPEAGEEKKNAENAAEKPAAQAGARGDETKPEDDRLAAEEVEAEIVDDGHSRPEEPARASVTPPSASGRRLGSPGVILLVILVAIAVLIAALWRFGAGRPDGTDGPPAEATPVERAGSADASAPAGADPGKIANDGAPAAKAPSEPAVGSEGRGLPPAPAPGTGANDAIQRAAKDAARRPPPDPEEDAGDAIDLGALAPDGMENAAHAAASEDDADTDESADSGVAEARPQNPVDGLKIANDFEAVKTALEAETRRLEEMLARARAENEAQAAEIAALRDSIQAAILERDRRAEAEFADLRARLDKIQSGEATPSSRRAAASLALLSLKNAIDSGGPYTDEIELFARLAPDAAPVEVLRARAGTGAPTRDALRERFAPLAREALAAAGRARAKGPVGAMMARLESLISVRPAAPLAGDDPAAVISRAEARLEAGDLEAAVAELEALDGEAAEVFAPWLLDARARLAADRALDDLRAAILRDYLN